MIAIAATAARLFAPLTIASPPWILAQLIP
jgi:hypothetical protein